MDLTQAVFKPSIKLELNKKYFLKFSHLTESENYHELTRYNSSNAEHEPVAWEVTESHSPELNLNLSLKFVQMEVEYYGCGPAAYAVFQPNNLPESEVWYKTEVYDETTKTSSTFIIGARTGIIRVGHGMCAGGFTFNNEGSYKVRFTPMNIDGKKLNTTKWKTLESPFKNSLGY
ncbi:hypothetical protein R9C00_27900 [Flammeovirgaceae bacterium SG7u.111]|nr:hypothetical protein [Flammeovirgaceae bacterium SG7u.132]WPO35524.1 hypothetical protein R9C00_27900 [Flammeovirgaceae bacterium SG7u.111]